MTRLRKAIAYRRLERAYTRYSKYKKVCYVRARPVCKVVSFDLGDPRNTYEYELELIAKTDLQIRDNAIESARQTSNRLLEKTIGKNCYAMKVRIYPHHILRENPLASGAGADRMSTGMAHSFGKPTSVLAQVQKDHTVFTAYVNKAGIDAAKQALQRANPRMPGRYYISMEEKTEATVPA